MRDEPSSDDEEAKGALGGKDPSDGIGDGFTLVLVGLFMVF